MNWWQLLILRISTNHTFMKPGLWDSLTRISKKMVLKNLCYTLWKSFSRTISSLCFNLFQNFLQIMKKATLYSSTLTIHPLFKIWWAKNTSWLLWMFRERYLAYRMRSLHKDSCNYSQIQCLRKIREFTAMIILESSQTYIM